VIEFRVAMEAPSTPNLREHHMARARRTDSQRRAISRKMPKWPGGPLLVVRLTRVAPRELDGDNLQGAMKGVRDQVAAGLRLDDRSPLVSWLYHQTKGQAEVVVQIWRDGEDAPPLPIGRPVEKGRARPGQKSPRGKAGASTREPRPAYEPPRKPRKVSFNDAMDALVPERRNSIPRGSPTHKMATTAIEPSNAAEHRALHAAMDAEATFAPQSCDCVGARHAEECVTAGRYE
jgi:hypothetical protein